ncbi:alpha/beta fold hydrolase [Ciceribacter sp. L1K22]|uniref:alpha/beta fold hydrolase n=1 Tax=Ciceribacter sp. L1K22 TaxID=2820275 RepID=UPI001ABDB8F1|nr:alpha/beta fold hydrolase [Ciceribacter sp. L1K22]MBO3759819.1 alpha/beta fold hydrolase [Ciceribacter sp. L1K22]
MASPLPVILLHGAWQGSWVWEKFSPALAAAGFRPIAVDLPGNGADDTPAEKVSLDLYLTRLRRVLDATGGRVAVIAHSGGGVVASALAEAAPDKIAGIVYIAGMMLPSGLGYGDLVRSALPDHPEAAGISPHLIWSDDGLLSRVPTEAAIRHFFNDLPEEEAAYAAARLTPQAEGGRALVARLTPGRFGRVPRLYVEATDDRSVYIFLQRRMQALVPGAEVATLATGHAPHVSAPALLAAPVIAFLHRMV